MGNGLLKEQQWRIFKRQVSYKQFLRDVHYANAIWSPATHPRSASPSL